ncbi:SPOR domain-containing protein [Shimia aestuarii]|uniref:SPOR domain-containing protein n=1 Tax=Shimia aestuarii TaxID=254406 RepID=UPI001FB52F78|nr:SPOR domain-containing protein [Shimia aestuarii]
MKLSRAIAIAVIAGSLGLGAAVEAQSLKNVDQPNEFPPASYKARQYVDSKGCVYIRAGVDGSVTWVPRMSRDRKVLCGFKPTQVAGASKQQAAPRLDKNVVTLKAAKPEQGAPKETAAPVTTARAKPTAAPTPRPAAPAKPRAVAIAPAKPAKAMKPATKPTAKPAKTVSAPATKKPRRDLGQVPRRAGVASPCRAGAGTYRGMAVRCGPQSELPYTPGTGNPTATAPVIKIDRRGSSYQGAVPGQVVREGEVGPDVRVVPRHIYENRKYAMVQVEPPEGYVRVFEDGRLNPHRGEQTFGGKARMDQIWHAGVPHELRRGEAGTSMVVSSKGAAPVVSTKSSPRRKALRIGGQGYVKVATYTDYTAAQSAARKVRALGMPVRIGTYESKGVTRRMVLAGPYGDAERAGSALAKVRGAGFGSAVLRK